MYRSEHIALFANSGTGREDLELSIEIVGPSLPIGAVQVKPALVIHLMGMGTVWMEQSTLPRTPDTSAVHVRKEEVTTWHKVVLELEGDFPPTFLLHATQGDQR